LAQFSSDAQQRAIIWLGLFRLPSPPPVMHRSTLGQQTQDHQLFICFIVPIKLES